MYGHRLIRELLGLLFLFCGLLMLLSLWSYHAGDPTFNQAVSIQASSVQNAAGLFGAYLAGFLVDSFGVGSFLWVVFFLAVGAGLVSRWLVLKWYRWLGYVLLFSCVLVTSSAFDVTVHGIHGGGITGQWLSALSLIFFSPSGSFLLWLFVFLIAMELSFSISWLTLISRLIAWVMRKIPSFGTTYDLPVPHVPSSLKRLAAKLGREKEGASRPRVVFDIIAGRKKKEPEQEHPALDLNLHEDVPEAKKPEESPKEENASGFLHLAEEPAVRKNELSDEVKSVPLILWEEESRAHEASVPKEEQEFILELDDPVGDASMEKPVAVESAAGRPVAEFSSLETACIQESDKGQEEHTEEPEEEELGPSALAALSARSSLREDDFPAVVVSSSHTGEKACVESSFTEEVKDEEYASVDTAVAGAMAMQKDFMAASSATTETPAPALPKRRELSLPPLDLLSPLPENDLASRPDGATLTRQGEALITCLKNFNVHATLARITPGPVVTLFEVRPAPGVKATRITNLANDLAMSLKAVSVRMQAPVPGTDTVGVEVPNEKRATVHFREIVENESFRQAKSLLTVALGKDTGGRPVSADLAKMPHLLVAGATGAGKSVCLNAIILSLLYRARPDEVQMILVDPKRVELSMYADLPHLVHPVVTDMDLTKNALLWAIDEMNRRLSLFSKVKVRNITGYNERQARLRAEVEAGGSMPLDAETGEPEDLSNMPFLVIIVDELSDLMMVKRKEVEGSIVRLAQLARAAGIHLIIATQRPSVDVVTGIIKANFPCRIAFKVTSGQDSRTILDGAGAEKLLGMGDMLFKPNGGMIQRLHGAFVSDEEVSAVVEYWKRQQAPNYKIDFSEFGSDAAEEGSEDFGQPASRGNDIVDDPIYAEAIQFVLDNGKVSISLLQRRFRIGFNRAARFVEQMEKDGLLSQADGTRPRSVVHR
ncbi:DNA translocase FtsK [Mailhella massiliensis]|uniref:DNA translocase FtsK 4TM domain-containing protein n=1 Tax=Mailhella massiliensis TaxID=1903261 RepID=A0A921AU35_9BACT|nr:DNA translocase FtsK [Mailhella massiliensis]HJD96375.1 DNA translocase FtsK 4TM domain-containing protein [Mailhella massiliensis]